RPDFRANGIPSGPPHRAQQYRLRVVADGNGLCGKWCGGRIQSATTDQTGLKPECRPVDCLHRLQDLYRLGRDFRPYTIAGQHCYPVNSLHISSAVYYTGLTGKFATFLVSFARLGHSRESGNLLRKPLEMCVVGLDSRFRGNDPGLDWIPAPNDTNTIFLKSKACGSLEPNRALNAKAFRINKLLDMIVQGPRLLVLPIMDNKLNSRS